MSRSCAALVFFFLTLFADNAVKTIDISFGDVTDILHFARETVTGGLEAVEWVRKSNPEDQEYDFPFIKKMERRLLNQISSAAQKINAYQDRLEVKMDENLYTLLRNLPLATKLDQSLRELTKLLGRVDDMFDDFEAYKTFNKFERYTLEEFASNCVSSAGEALPNLLQEIHRLVVPEDFLDYDNSILVLLAQTIKEAEKQICNGRQSPQQLLYNLYNKIALTEIKGRTMMQLSYDLLRLYSHGNFTEEIERMTSKYDERTRKTLKAVQIAMAFAPREMWRCDPTVHKEDSTYTELKQLFQGYVVNEVDLNPTSTCKENCGYYNFASVNGCYGNQYCSQQRRCNGKVLNCQYIDSDMWICPSAKTSNRRYEYIEYENGRVYGNKGTCKRGTTKVDSWWRWLFWHCSYCMCTCDDHNSSSDRYFSLRDVFSDTANNRVITGLKFEKVNKIIHLVIQEGKLLEKGKIDESTVAWKKMDNFTILDRDVENGRDYHTLAWEKRALDLDDLSAPENHVLTGVRFRVVGAHLNFEIYVTPFNFTTGKLRAEKSIWHSNDNTDIKDPGTGEKARVELKLVKPDVPTRIRASSSPDSRSNQYLNFAPTDLEKDAAQTTVPFLDVQPVTTIPAFPLAGAGIYHKGRDGSGGFVAPRIITYDFSKHLNADLPPQRPVLGGGNEIPVV